MTMRMKSLAPAAGFVILLLLLACSGRLAYGQAQNEPVVVEASDLDRRADLVGKVVSVDDRVRFYQFHPGQGYDELRLKRTDVVFRLPPPLRPESSPRPDARDRAGEAHPRRRTARLRGDRPEGPSQRPRTSRPGHRGPARERFREPEGLGGLGRAPR